MTCVDESESGSFNRDDDSLSEIIIDEESLGDAEKEFSISISVDCLFNDVGICEGYGDEEIDMQEDCLDGEEGESETKWHGFLTGGGVEGGDEGGDGSSLGVGEGDRCGFLTEGGD